MSATIGTGYGIMPTVIANSTMVRQQLDTLTEQASTGLVAQTYAGLGGQSSVSLNLNPQISALQTYQTNIGQALGSMQVTQTAMTQIQQVASTFVADIPNLNDLNASKVDSIASNARAALTQVAGLLDTTNGNSYVFGGQDTANPPVPAPDNILSSGFYTQINTAVSSLSTNGAAATIATTIAVGESNTSGTSSFSTYMSQPGTALSTSQVQTGDGITVQTGLLASANVTAISTGTSTTGSYMRDLMRTLATLESLSSLQVNDPNFAALVRDTGTSLTGAVNAMATDVGVLGNSQASLTATQSQLTTTATAFSGQVSSAQDVHMADTLSDLTAMQTQLQESYRLITTTNSLSLINFLRRP